MIDPFNTDAQKLHLIQCTLSALVPIAIMDLQEQGGPDERHYASVTAFGDILGSEGDTLLYSVKGKTGKNMGKFCEVLAIMAFVPGGITVFGLHFEAKVGDAPLNLCTDDPYHRQSSLE